MVRKFGLSDRFSYIEGDVLKADFGNGYDIAPLGHISHTEGVERSRKLLKKTFNALKSGGTIAIGEWLVNDQRTEPVAGLMFAVNMLVRSEQGNTFSFNEIKAGCKKLASKTRVQSKHMDLHHWCSRSSPKSPLPAQMDGFSFIVGNVLIAPR